MKDEAKMLMTETSKPGHLSKHYADLSESEKQVRTDYAERQSEERKRDRLAFGPKWYVVQCIRGTDQQALDAFDRFKMETYYPKILQLKPMPRRRMSASQRAAGLTIQAPTEVALFPRYVFTRFDLMTEAWRSAFELAGVGGLICRDGQPVFMPDGVIASIRARENNGVIPGKDSVRALFAIGDNVVVTDGPFASFPGIVERGLDVPIEKLEPSMRIKVAVNIFGRATPVDLEYWQVAKQDDQ